MNNLDRQYLDLLGDVLDNGVKKNDRTGVGTYSVFGRMIRHDMGEGFPLLTTKKIYTKALFHELLWFLQGGDNIKYLVDNGVRIWNEWPYERFIKHEGAEVDKLRDSGVLVDYQRTTMEEYLEKIRTDDVFAAEWGSLGPVYGRQWRYWLAGEEDGEPVFVDQIADILNLLKNDPDSRRILVSAWNPGQLKDMLLPPCHYVFQLWTKELTAKERYEIYKKQDLSGFSTNLSLTALCDSTDVQHDKQINIRVHEFMDVKGVPSRSVSLMFQMRSVDCFVGKPFDIASYGGLLHIIAHCTGMHPEELIVVSGDTHVYLNHVEQAKLQMGRVPYELPTFEFSKDVPKDINKIRYEHIDGALSGYEYHPAIKADIAV